MTHVRALRCLAALTSIKWTAYDIVDKNNSEKSGGRKIWAPTKDAVVTFPRVRLEILRSNLGHNLRVRSAGRDILVVVGQHHDRATHPD